MIESRPPGASTLSELLAPASISSSSLFTQMRTALEGNGRGCLNLYLTGVAAATTSASSLRGSSAVRDCAQQWRASNTFGKTLAECFSAPVR